MKRYRLINIISIFIIIGSVAAWYFFLPRYLDVFKSNSFFESEDSEENVRVEGLRSFSTGDEKKEPKQSITFGQLFASSPESPTKKDDFGDTYMRAASAIAIDVDSGTILHYQNGKQQMAIASLTKIMTAIITVENIPDLENEIVMIGETPLYAEGTRVGCPRTGYCISTRLQYQEKISAKYLLEAMLMNSANDAAIALAEHIAGSEEKFAKLMNDKARELGLDDTHLCNSSGLDIEGREGQCYSSAYDLARIAAYSLRYDVIWDIMKVKDKDVYSADGMLCHQLINTDILLDQMPNCIGGKTGFTYEAGRSLMMAAHHPTDKGRKVVAVLLNDEYRWEDMRHLFEWTFSAYIWPLPQFN